MVYDYLLNLNILNIRLNQNIYDDSLNIIC